MKTLNEMNKAELRAECKAVGVKGYGNMDNAAMRSAIQIVRDVEVAKVVTKTPVNRDVAMGTGIKIEKNREEQNGIKRPSAGGVCREIWDFCSAQAKTPTLKEVKAQAAVKGWDLVTTAVQYYQWRKFSGIVGRI